MELTQFQQQSELTPPPPSVSQVGDSQPLQQQSINLHFGAIDPVQFDSTKIFDQNQIAGHFFNQSSNKSEIGLNSVPQFSTSDSANMPAPSEAPPPSSQPESMLTTTMKQPPIETFSRLSTLQQQQYQHQHQQINTSPLMAETVNDSANIRHQNQELNGLLQIEKMRNHELSVRVTQQHSTIEGLTTELNQLRKCANTITALQQQVNAHTQTVNILVSEKSDMSAKLQQRDQRIADYESECVELQGRLKASRHRVAELEKDLNTLAESHQKYDGSQQVLCTELETLQDENKHLKRLHQEACDENTEFQHQLAQKIREIDELKVIVGAKNSELEMAQVRLEQLTGGDPTQSIATKQWHCKRNYKQSKKRNRI